MHRRRRLARRARIGCRVLWQGLRCSRPGANAAARPGRFWRLGLARSSTIAELLAASDLHVYASRPYPLAQSLLEAMAAGRVVLAWDSEPVREVLTPGQNGLLAPLDDAEAAFLQTRAVLRQPAEYAGIGQAATALVREHYARDVTLPKLVEHLQRLVERGG